MGDFRAESDRFATSAVHPRAHRAVAGQGVRPVWTARSLLRGRLLIGLPSAVLWPPAAWSNGDAFTAPMNTVTERVRCRTAPDSLMTGSGFIVDDGPARMRSRDADSRKSYKAISENGTTAERASCARAANARSARLPRASREARPR